MNILNTFLKNKDRAKFAKKVKCSKGHIDNLCSDSTYVPGRKLAARIEKATNGELKAIELLYPETKGAGVASPPAVA